MAGLIELKAGTLTTLLNDTAVAGASSLTSLAAGSAVASAAFDNTASLAFFGDFELTILFAVAPTAGKTIDLYLLESVDGTQYADGSTGASPILVDQHYIGSFKVRNVATKQVITLRNIDLPAAKFEIQLYNNTDQAFAAQNSGSLLRLLPQLSQYT